jgi:hypothetical protein
LRAPGLRAGGFKSLVRRPVFNLIIEGPSS